MTARIHVLFAIVTSLAVTAAIAWGFYLVGSPNSRRVVRFDEQRLRDLQLIAQEIQRMVIEPEHSAKLKEALPKSLEEAAKRAVDQKLNIRDPETGEPYQFTVKSDSTYELCATFALPRDWDSAVFWNHPAGKHCFTVDVFDPPPYW